MTLIPLCDTLITQVIGEIVDLAAKHTKTKAEYRIFPMSHYDDDQKIRDDAIDYGSIWIEKDKDPTPFLSELARLEDILKVPLNEPVLPDDHPVHQGYLYVVNGHRVVEFIDGMRMTVGLWKTLRIKDVEPVHLVQRCDMAGRIVRAPAIKKSEPYRGWDASGRSIHQKKRKSRNSNKIKKVSN